MSATGVSIKALAAALSCPYEGDGEMLINRPNEPASAQKNEIALAADPKFLEALHSSNAKAAILPLETDWQSYDLEAAIFVQSARKVMVEISKAFEIPWSRHWGSEPLHASSIVHPSARLGNCTLLGPFSMIAENTVIGEETIIHDHVSIAQDVKIGRGCQIYSGVRIGPEVVIGDDVIVMANSVIGADGFSYLTPNAEAIRKARDAGDAAALSDLEIERINSLGSVVIGDRVEIGAGVMIDRGTLKNTIIGEGSKIDNLVHIAHNVKIGENCLICGQVGIAGSAVIGDRTILGGQVGVSDNIVVGSDVIAAGKSALSSTVPPRQVVMGNPAFKMASNIESYKAYRRLPGLFTRVKELESILKKKGNSSDE